MPEILLFQDPIARAISYLSQWVPASAGPHLDIPPKWKWGPLLVTVTDTGGPGEKDVVLDQARVTVDVYHEDSERASDVARKLHGLIRAWHTQENGVRFLTTLTRPTYRPEDATGTPGFFFTVELLFKAAPFEFNSL